VQLGYALLGELLHHVHRDHGSMVGADPDPGQWQK
jgi:hypothetical protein